MFEYWQKSFFELCSKIFSVQNDLSKAKNENYHLHDQYASVSASYVDLKQYTATQTKSSVKISVWTTENKKQLATE